VIPRAVPPERLPADLKALVERAVSDRRHGWWFRAVFEAFGYLESEFGYSLTQVNQHFRGNDVSYDGPAFDLVIAYDPQNSGSVSAELWVHADQRGHVEHPRAFTVNDVLRARDPAIRLPDTDLFPNTKAEVLEAITLWSVGLRDVGADVLRGAWPRDVPMQFLW
jgi:hypothetical protein